jgi:hypothetical protein
MKEGLISRIGDDLAHARQLQQACGGQIAGCVHTESNTIRLDDDRLTLGVLGRTTASHAENAQQKKTRDHCFLH